jgi:hypothetical protein
MNLPRIHISPENFSNIIDEMKDVIIFREYGVPAATRFSLIGYAGNKVPDIFIVYNGIIISTDASISITNYKDFKINLIKKENI